MNTVQRAGTMAAIAVTGAAVAIGGVGLAAADDDTTSGDSTSQVAPRGPGGPGGAGRGFGHGKGQRGGHGEGAAALAEALGLDEADVTAAFEAVRENLRPEAPEAGEDRTRPSEDEREARKAEFITALADELGVTEQALEDAFESLVGDRKAEARDGLSERLNEAVDEGTLTEADKASVLKAFDAGVLGGERRGR